MVSNRKKRILLVVKYPIGGIRTYLRDVYNQVVFDEYNFTILTPLESAEDLKGCVLNGRNIRYITFKSNMDLIIKVVRVLKECRYDLVHSHGFSAGLLSCLPVYIMRTRHLLTAHDIFQENQFNGFKGILKQYIIGAGMRLVDCNMAVSGEAKENIGLFYPSLDRDDKLVMIQNGIDIKKYNIKGRRDFYKELGVDNDYVLFGFFGRFMKQKGFGVLVDAVNELKTNNPDMNFRIIAFGWGGFIREEQEYIRNLGIEEYFYFMPYTDEMAMAIKGVDAVIMPSLWEACPLLPMEVMVSGVPLISSDCIGLNEVTMDTPAITFGRGKVRLLVSAMTEFFNNMVSHKKDAIAYKSQARLRYDVANTARKLGEQYNKLIDA